MERLSAFDRAFLQLESEKFPMHVGGVLLFSQPAGRPGFSSELAAQLRRPVACAPPFDRRIERSPLPFAPPAWKAVSGFDPGPHVHASEAPPPADHGALFDHVVRLHAPLLDLSRPPWECHVISGLAEGRVALYFKVHHAAVDGVSGLRRIQNSLSSSPDEITPPLWAEKRTQRRAAERPRRPPLAAARETLAALRDYVRLQRTHPRELPGFTAAPVTSLGGRLSHRRTLRAVTIPLGGARALAASVSGTVNDVVLALVAGALRRYFEARGERIGAPLVAVVPISVHDEQSREQLSNRVCTMLVTLPTDLEEPRARLRFCHDVMVKAKAFIHGLSPEASLALTMLAFTPGILAALLGLSHLVPAPFNVLVSNVPGPRQPLYCSGAALEAIYPVSGLFERQGLNVTLTSYLDRLTISLLGCPDVCEVPLAARAFEEAWQELSA